MGPLDRFRVVKLSTRQRDKKMYWSGAQGNNGGWAEDIQDGDQLTYLEGARLLRDLHMVGGCHITLEPVD